MALGKRDVVAIAVTGGLIVCIAVIVAVVLASTARTKHRGRAPRARRGGRGGCAGCDDWKRLPARFHRPSDAGSLSLAPCLPLADYPAAPPSARVGDLETVGHASDALLVSSVEHDARQARVGAAPSRPRTLRLDLDDLRQFMSDSSAGTALHALHTHAVGLGDVAARFHQQHRTPHQDGVSCVPTHSADPICKRAGWGLAALSIAAARCACRQLALDDHARRLAGCRVMRAGTVRVSAGGEWVSILPFAGGRASPRNRLWSTHGAAVVILPLPAAGMLGDQASDLSSNHERLATSLRAGQASASTVEVRCSEGARQLPSLSDPAPVTDALPYCCVLSGSGTRLDGCSMRAVGVGDQALTVVVVWLWRPPAGSSVLRQWFSALLGRAPPQSFGEPSRALVQLARPEDSESMLGRSLPCGRGTVQGDTINNALLRAGAAAPRPGRVDALSRRQVAAAGAGISDADAESLRWLCDSWMTVMAREGRAVTCRTDGAVIVELYQLRAFAPALSGPVQAAATAMLGEARRRGWDRHMDSVRRTPPDEADLAPATATLGAGGGDRGPPPARLHLERVRVVRRCAGMAWHSDTSRISRADASGREAAADGGCGLVGHRARGVPPDHRWFPNHSPQLSSTALLHLGARNMDAQGAEGATEVASGGGRIVRCAPGSGLIMEGGSACVHRVSPFHVRGADKVRYNVVMWMSLRAPGDVAVGGSAEAASGSTSA